MAIEFQHVPVLLEETLAHLNLRPGAVVLDGTLGGGSHAEAILERTSPTGVVIGLDRDAAALAAAGQRLARFGDRFQAVQESFRHLDSALASVGFERVDGVLLDLGVSSHQLDEASRGFRFASEGAADTQLDMRMDRSSGERASDLLRRASSEELERWFSEYGELPGARRLARAITETRSRQPIETTADLLQVIQAARVGGGRKHNPATLVFQALRIAVNDELGALREGLLRAIASLREDGRLVVISYHSLEDRIVKHTLRTAQRGCTCPPRTPVCICGGSVTVEVVTKRPIGPSDEEVRANPRARSARLRAARRVGVDV